MNAIIGICHAHKFSRNFTVKLIDERICFIGSANDMLKVCRDLENMEISFFFENRPIFRTGRVYEVEVFDWNTYYIDEEDVVEGYYGVSRLTPFLLTKLNRYDRLQ